MKSGLSAASLALLAAALYALNTPLSKLLLGSVGKFMMASLLYLGAGIGMAALLAFEHGIGIREGRGWLSREDLLFTVMMVLLDIAAPVLLMFGIARTDASNVSLLNNFEIVATTIVAMFAFKEPVSTRLWVAVVLATVSSAILACSGSGTFSFNTGSLFVLAATICWGFENNCTRMLSHKSSKEIVMVKGCFSGLGSFLLAILAGEGIPGVKTVFAVMLLGFVSYGLSINLYIKAQSRLGAAKTSAFYSIAPFIGAALGLLILDEHLSPRFCFALAVMAVATVFMVWDTLASGDLDSGGKR